MAGKNSNNMVVAVNAAHANHGALQRDRCYGNNLRPSPQCEARCFFAHANTKEEMKLRATHSAATSLANASVRA